MRPVLSRYDDVRVVEFGIPGSDTALSRPPEPFIAMSPDLVEHPAIDEALGGLEKIFWGWVAIVTGAASGIGAAIAETFHREGAKVVALDISGKQDALVQRLGSDCVSATVDVSHSADFERVISETVGRFGRLDVLVNNAGIDGQIAPTTDYDEAEFNRVLAVNAKSVFLGMKFAISEMLKSGGGAIVNTASTPSLVGLSHMPAYCAS